MVTVYNSLMAFKFQDEGAIHMLPRKWGLTQNWGPVIFTLFQNVSLF